VPGARLAYEVSGTTLVQVSRAADDAGTGGNHCKKGRFGYGHVQSAERLRRPLLRVGRELQETSPTRPCATPPCGSRS